MRWRPVRWLCSLLLVVGCQSPEEAEVDEGWSGTPPLDPAEIGEACEATWVPCVDGAFCDYGSDSPQWACGDIGVCSALPAECDDTSDPVCACDGQRYENPCEAAMAGVGTRGAVGCDPPPGTVGCGSSFCAIDSEYCEYVVGHGQSPTWRCLPLVCIGSLAGCECLAEPLCSPEDGLFAAEYCEETGDGATVVTCVPP